MTKRRTRKQKQRAAEAIVKGQLKKAKKTRQKGQSDPKKALKSAKDATLADTKKEIIKSLVIASLILALEIVIYLAQ